ncbi:N-acetyl-gamma-glutamyl-phosphate reductase [Ignatzschineria rhizosphaerae]|uniref:N-acetyl-gamma-glutamyl-phosphate reductase n=1 Tax=Ignatzschineria rhizosphaerae TaxID=2923279 RepID=A0ABY3X0G8_9GAMM|nr:N-acetyl-gamma-glutamyl-phosphate reductase [Ignatzschineria rhizosphaerae]UNM94967.1 N-acetyl-gamma-glutamyl-phosphate reductase [Ignatzschineria rhizosphaerae]
MIRVGIIGVTGYAGQQLLWLLEQHPEVDIRLLSSKSYADMDIAEVYPNFEGRLSHTLLKDQDFMARIDEIDLLFMALPHGLSQELGQVAYDNGVKVIDLGADFRFEDTNTYEAWYKVPHKAKDLSKVAVYGLPELHRERIAKSPIIASPGCFPTSAILGAAPLIVAKKVETDMIVDSKTGTTGAGRDAKTTSLYCEVNENFKPYGLFNHRHTPEMEKELEKLTDENVDVLFTPHLLPVNRGILSTIYFNLKKGVTLSEEEAYQIYQAFYQDEPFVRVRKGLPELSHVRGTNFCDIAIRVDSKRGKVIVIAAIDNLIKGAAGQAVQSMNILFGFPEETGLSSLSMYI